MNEKYICLLAFTFLFLFSFISFHFSLFLFDVWFFYMDCLAKFPKLQFFFLLFM